MSSLLPWKIEQGPGQTSGKSIKNTIGQEAADMLQLLQDAWN
jgi:hypothetical protein